MTLYSRKTKTFDLGFSQRIECTKCNRAGTLQAFKSYRQFSINFIPLFKYKKKWYLKTTCCGQKYEVSKEFGKKLEAKEITEVSVEDLINGKL